MKNLIDLTLLREFSNGDEAFLDKMKLVFIEETTINISKIEAALTAGDLGRVSEIAHSIKPSLDYLSVKSLREKVRQIEKQDFDLQKDSEFVSLFITDLKELLLQLQ